MPLTATKGSRPGRNGTRYRSAERRACFCSTGISADGVVLRLNAVGQQGEAALAPQQHLVKSCCSRGAGSGRVAGGARPDAARTCAIGTLILASPHRNSEGRRVATGDS